MWNLRLVRFCGRLCLFCRGEEEMAVIDKEKYFAKKEDMLAFIIQNKEQFGERFYSLISFIGSDLGLELQEYSPMILREIFSKFDLYYEGADEYRFIAGLLEKYQFLDGNCLEVGAGFYPRLAEILLPSIKGSLTLYDPDIHFTDLDAKIIKEPFTRKSDISSCDTLYALYPCGGTIPVLEKAFREDKNLLLAFCDCDHSSGRYQKRGNDYWANYVCHDYLKRYGNDIEVLHWPFSVCNLDLPIMIRESHKQKRKVYSEKR